MGEEISPSQRYFWMSRKQASGSKMRRVTMVERVASATCSADQPQVWKIDAVSCTVSPARHGMASR